MWDDTSVQLKKVFKLTLTCSYCSIVTLFLTPCLTSCGEFGGIAGCRAEECRAEEEGLEVDARSRFPKEEDEEEEDDEEEDEDDNNDEDVDEEEGVVVSSFVKGGETGEEGVYEEEEDEEEEEEEEEEEGGREKDEGVKECGLVLPLTPSPEIFLSSISTSKPTPSSSFGSAPPSPPMPASRLSASSKEASLILHPPSSSSISPSFPPPISPSFPPSFPPSRPSSHAFTDIPLAIVSTTT